MGWETIQPTPASPVGERITAPEPSRQQSALAGHDVDTAPPCGFRQRITQGLVRLGRRLSSLVCAPPSSARRTAPDPAASSTRKQLVSLLKLVHSGGVDQAKLGVALDKLEHEKQQWLQSDPAHAAHKFADMVRGVLDQHWPGGKTVDLEKALAAMAGPNFASLPQGALREQLATLVSDSARDHRAVEALKARHNDEIRSMGFAEAKKMAESVFWKGPVLSAALKAFDKAEKVCEYKAGATEVTLQAARDALEDAGNRLLEALEATHPKKAAKAIARRRYAYQSFSALAIKARNQAQANLYSEFADDYIGPSGDTAATVRKIAQAKALRARVAQDGPPRQRGAPRGPEEQYFLKLRKQGDYLQQVSELQAPDDDPDMRELRESLDRLPP